MRAGLAETQFPFFARLTAVGRQELGALPVKRAAPGAHVLRRGDPTNGAYLVVAGSLRVYYTTSEGREATLYHVEPGGTCVLALSATFENGPYPAWVDAGPAGGGFACVPNAAFRRLLDTESAFRDFVFGAMSGRLFELMRTLEETASTQVEQRVARYLLRQHAREVDGTVRVSQAGIAAELGTAREVVFRALRSLVETKLIETGRMRIRILDVDGLVRLTGGPTRRARDARRAGP
jgi:CRP/FNR family transcriptional regulator